MHIHCVWTWFTPIHPSWSPQLPQPANPNKITVIASGHCVIGHPTHRYQRADLYCIQVCGYACSTHRYVIIIVPLWHWLATCFMLSLLCCALSLSLLPLWHIIVIVPVSHHCHWHPASLCQVWVYSGRGSGQVRTEADEGREQRAGQGVSLAGVETDWIQWQGGRALIPCIGSSQAETEAETDREWE